MTNLIVCSLYLDKEARLFAITHKVPTSLIHNFGIPNEEQVEKPKSSSKKNWYEPKDSLQSQ